MVTPLTQAYRGLSCSEDVLLFCCIAGDDGKASSLSALYDLNRPLSPGQDDQLLSIAPLEYDGYGFIEYAKNDGWKRV